MAQILLTHQLGKIITFPQPKSRARKDSSLSVNSYPCKRQIIIASQANTEQKKDSGEESVEIIRERFGKIDLSVSSYDTAWVAMVPSTNQQQQPCFPNCLEWIKENQKADGSWGLNPSHPSLVKDSLSSTLACILALQKWRVGEQLVQKGLDFIGSNKYAIMDRHQSSPIGFDIVFPGMINYANELNLNMPLDPAFMNLMLRNRDFQLQSCKHKGISRLGFFAEGLGKSYEWEEMIKKEQRSNGSLFNSPASTAAALIHLHDDKCFDYLHSLVQIHGKAVPAIYPFDIYNRICTVDTIERLGISRHFQHEIKIVLDETYRCWQQRDEEIFSDVACCAMAFRLLRMNGYQVSSDVLGEFVDQEHFFNTVSLQFTNTETITQLYRASQIPLYQNEHILDKINAWTSTFLRHQLLNQEIYDEQLRKEVEYAFGYPIDNLDRLTHRRGIELYHTDKFRMLKTSYRSTNIDNENFLMYARDDFNKCQALHLEEIQQLEKWVKNSRIARLEFDWHILISCYVLNSATNFAPEFKDARIVCTQTAFLGTIIDDLFDVDGSKDELLNLIELVERWDGHSDIVSGVAYSSERIETVFLALQEIINDQATKLLARHGRCLKQQRLQTWRRVLNTMFIEWEWWKNNSTPTLDEFLTNGVGAAGTGLFTLHFYFLGIELSSYLFNSEEYRILESHIGGITRLFNDYRSLERDLIQRKINPCYLIVSHSHGTKTLEDAKAEVRRMIEFRRREALRMMLQPKPGSVIPKEVVESFFNLNKIAYYLYNEADEFRAPGKTIDDIRGFLYDSLNLL